MKKIAFFAVIILALCGAAFPQQYLDTPERAASGFFYSLGSHDYLKSYRMLTNSSKNYIIKKGIDRFSDLDDRVYEPSDMDFYITTNSEGHRTVLFEDLLGAWCRKNGIKPENLKNPKFSASKKKTDGKYLVCFLVNGKPVNVVMLREDYAWKAVWRP